VTFLAKSTKWAIANSEIAGQKSQDIIKNWSFQENLEGLKQTLSSLSN